MSSRIYFGICPTSPVVCDLGQMLKLSWICSTLAEFRLRSLAPTGSICSLSGFHFVQPYANSQVQHDIGTQRWLNGLPRSLWSLAMTKYCHPELVSGSGQCWIPARIVEQIPKLSCSTREKRHREKRGFRFVPRLARAIRNDTA